MNDEELAKDLSLRMNPQPSSKAWENWDSDWKLSWLDIARRARELLCVNTLPLLTPEAEAVLSEAIRTVDDLHLIGSKPYARLESAVRAYREAQKPRPRWVVMPNGIVDDIESDSETFIKPHGGPLPERLKLAQRICDLLNRDAS